MMPAGAVLLAAVAAGAAPQPALLERAIRARGGPLESVVRRVEADVRSGFPGLWNARLAYRRPDRWALTIETTGAPDSYTWDGTAAHTVIGSRTVAVDRSPATPLHSQARFWSVVYLDALRGPGVEVTPLERQELPPGVVWGLLATWRDDGSRYRLGVDEADRVVWVRGPVQLPPFGSAELTMRFTDFRRTGRFLLPWRAEYWLAGAAILEERTLSACPDDPAATDAAFVDPALLPSCAAAAD
ncbi:MAG: hypothetical protein KIT14_21910 [bacterium]|nr:hypothetical protein [bacterium]